MFISHYFYLPQKDRIVILLIKSCDPANKKRLTALADVSLYIV